MAVSVKHTFVSPKADGVDSTFVQPSNWNSEHTMSMATAKVLGRMTAGTGVVEELPLVVDPTGQSLRIPGGTTAQRPVGVAGMMRFNSTTGILEAFQNGVWGNFADIATAPLPQDVVVGRAHLAGTGPQQNLTKPQLQRLVFNIGNMYPTFNGGADNGFVLPVGQNLNRITYADLFAMWSTAYGAGDGVNTFGIPDVRGRALAGADNMGGAAAGRLTGGISGISGGLGSAGGLEYHYLTEAQMPWHQHAGNTGGESTDHAHTITQPSYYGMNGGGGRGWSRADSGGQVATLGSDGRNAGHYHSVTVDGRGSSVWHPNVQPTICCYWQIYTGVYT